MFAIIQTYNFKDVLYLILSKLKKKIILILHQRRNLKSEMWVKNLAGRDCSFIIILECQGVTVWIKNHIFLSFKKKNVFRRLKLYWDRFLKIRTFEDLRQSRHDICVITSLDFISITYS